MRVKGGEDVFFFKQKTAYEIKECDWSSDVCSSDLAAPLSERRPDHGDRRPMVGSLDAIRDLSLQRLEQKLAGSGDYSARNHDELGIKDVRQARQADGDPAGELAQERHSIVCTNLCRFSHLVTLHGLDIAPSPSKNTRRGPSRGSLAS